MQESRDVLCDMRTGDGERGIILPVVRLRLVRNAIKLTRTTG